MTINNNPSNQHNHLFTLVELLIVVAILAILCSLISPALRKAHATGLQLVCSKNLSDIGSASFIYADDNNDWSTFGRTELPTLMAWSGMLLNGGYVVDKSLLCPAAENAGLTKESHSYGLNYTTFGFSPLHKQYIGIKLHDVARRGNTENLIWYGDSASEAGNSPYAIGWNIYLYDSTTFHMVHLRHLQMGNFVFLDGHVAGLEFVQVKDTNKHWLPRQDGSTPGKLIGPKGY
jgi:prepilin-type N-terminal cleavage/methylation domain-containing protein/prepilin-type processing-associated H-X9-DG protein